MKYLSVCSGIEAASVAWNPLGWKPLAFSEIEPFPRAVLARHYPDVPLHGDFTVLRDQRWIVDADILVGGTPCQAFSVAGLRNSLSDNRGNLTLEYVRLANAIDNLRTSAGRSPSIIVWENVPGVLSVKDNAFGSFLAGLAGEDVPLEPPGGKWKDAGCVIGPQRTIAWRTLDAQFFSLAQRRRRVFVVASARNGFDPASVLLEFEGVRRDTPPRREAREATTHSIAPSLTSSGRGVEQGGDTRGQNPVVAMKWPAEIAGTLDTHFGDKQGLEDQHVNAGCPLFVPSISPCLETQVGGLRQPCTQAYVVTPPLTASMSTPLGNGGKDDFIVARTLSARHDSSPCVDREMDVIASHMAVRRLTPVECERLQGFPDDYLPSVTWRGKCPPPDGPMYKALGNSMAVPCMRWIGQRIANAVA